MDGFPFKYGRKDGADVTLTGTTQAVGPFVATVVRISTDNGAYYRVGADPTAAADNTSALLPPNSTIEIRIEEGDKIAVIEFGTAGIFNVALAQ